MNFLTAPHIAYTLAPPAAAAMLPQPQQVVPFRPSVGLHV